MAQLPPVKLKVHPHVRPNDGRSGIRHRQLTITWPDGTVQDLVAYMQSVTNPVQSYKISLGGMKMIKTVEDFMKNNAAIQLVKRVYEDMNSARKHYYSFPAELMC